MLFCCFCYTYNIYIYIFANELSDVWGPLDNCLVCPLVESPLQVPEETATIQHKIYRDLCISDTISNCVLMFQVQTRVRWAAES